MAQSSKIEWTDATWNPITGCALVSEGCRHCYAARLAGTRLKHHPSRKGLARQNSAGEWKFTGAVRFNEQWLEQPLQWRKPRKIFVCAHGDLFAEGVPDDWIDDVFAVMASAWWHTFQVLTKRPERMQTYMRHADADGHTRAERISALRTLDVTENWPLPNVWIGVSVEDQARAEERIPALLDTPAAQRFVSAEPLLGRLDLTSIEIGGCDAGPGFRHDALAGVSYDPAYPLPLDDCPRLDWVIVGGESGPHARPMHPDWARSLRDQCAAADVPFFFKQWGNWKPVYDRDRDDPDWQRCDIVSRQTPRGRWLNLAGGHGFHGERVVRVVSARTRGTDNLLDGQLHHTFPERP